MRNLRIRPFLSYLLVLRLGSTQPPFWHATRRGAPKRSALRYRAHLGA
jgi:hypothetical protein